MKSLCLFASYFTQKQLPYYIGIYLIELKHHFDEVVLLSSKELTDEKDILFLGNNKIKFQLENNEGYDFGLWYKALLKINTNEYEQIALVNDSCILFAPLNKFMAWKETEAASMLGMSISDAISPHLQSYFLVLKKDILPLTLNYFNEHKVLKDLHQVIKIYEIGLSTYILSNGFKIAAFIDNNSYSGEFSPYYHCLEYHLQKGIPLIKKKVLFSSFRKDELFTLARMNFNIYASHYIKLIKKYHKELILDFNKLKADKKGSIKLLQLLLYNFKRRSITWLRPFYSLLKK